MYIRLKKLQKKVKKVTGYKFLVILRNRRDEEADYIGIRYSRQVKLTDFILIKRLGEIEKTASPTS